MKKVYEIWFGGFVECLFWNEMHCGNEEQGIERRDRLSLRETETPSKFREISQTRVGIQTLQGQLELLKKLDVYRNT